MRLHPHDLDVLVDHCRSAITAARNALAFLNGCWVTDIEPEPWMDRDDYALIDVHAEIKQLDRAMHHLGDYAGTGLHPTDELFAICKGAIFPAIVALTGLERLYATQTGPRAGLTAPIWRIDEHEALAALNGAFTALEGFGIRAVNEDERGRFDLHADE